MRTHEARDAHHFEVFVLWRQVGCEAEAEPATSAEEQADQEHMYALIYEKTESPASNSIVSRIHLG